MKSLNASLIICFTCLLLMSIGCKTLEKAEKKSPLKKKNSSYLLNKLKDNELQYEWLSVRAATNAEIGDKKLDITMKIRIRKDSAIWISISPALGIEVARIIMTKDSLKFVNRLDKSYFAGSINYLDTLAPVSINYAMVQALITGNNLVIREDQETVKPDKYKVEIDNGNYLLSTLKRKKYDKTLKGKKTADATVNRIWLQPKTFKVTKSEITNFKSNKTIMASYDQFEEVEEQLCGHLVNVVMQADQHLSMKLNYSKVILNKPLKMPFRIPRKYESLE
ncbi:MAG: DUF4292 domain-containing protein [Flavobacteriales bacterium]|nr:DUF4292 domain-containing protein [Flavobacteriales bacterium]